MQANTQIRTKKRMRARVNFFLVIVILVIGVGTLPGTLATFKTPTGAQLEEAETIQRNFTENTNNLSTVLVYNATQNIYDPAVFQLIVTPVDFNATFNRVSLKYIQIFYGPYQFFVNFTNATTIGNSIIENFGMVSFVQMEPDDNATVWFKLGVGFIDAVSGAVTMRQYTTTNSTFQTVNIFDPAGKSTEETDEEGLWFMFWEVPAWAIPILTVVTIVGISLAIWGAGKAVERKKEKKKQLQVNFDAKKGSTNSPGEQLEPRE